MAAFLLLLYLIAVVERTSAAAELLKNAGFESGTDSWICVGCKGLKDTSALSGSSSYKVTSRSESWAGPRQSLGSTVSVGKLYSVSTYVKLLGVTATPQRFSITMEYALTDGTSFYHGITSLGGVSPTSGWRKLSASFAMRNPGKPIKGFIIYVEGPAAGMEFLVDEFSLTEIPNTPQWKTEANSRIDRIRKGDLTIQVNSTRSLGPLLLEIKQLRHEFGFGSAVDATLLISNQKYRDWFMQNFEWAVLENHMKWRFTENVRGVFTWTAADKAVDLLVQAGKKIRGHAITWSEKGHNPDWVQNIVNPSELHAVCMKRVTDIVTHYKGRIQHWDVNNEMTAHSFFRDVYKSDQINYDMFKKAKEVDPTAMLFLNDFANIETDQRSQVYVDQAKQFLGAGSPVQGLGIQGHFSGYVPGPLLMNRLDRLAEPGLPIWVTELDYVNSDPKKRADVLEETLTSFFSHPKVHGILLWGFWDGRHWRGANASLVEGTNFNVNAAGLMWQRLFHTQWRSNIQTSWPALGPGMGFTSTSRVFYGDYEVNIKSTTGTILKRQTVSMKKANTPVRMQIRL